MTNLRDISTTLGTHEAALRVSLYAALGRAVGLPGDGRRRVLDIGCGRGELLRALEQKGFKCFGVDVEAECVRLAATYGTTFLGGFDSLDTLGFQDQSDLRPDVVVSSHVLEHVDHPLLCLRQARELNAGRYVFAVPNVLRSVRLVRAVFGSVRADHPTHVFGWTRPEFQALLSRAGFETFEWYCDRVTLNPLGGTLGAKVTRLLAPLETRLLPKIFPLLASSLIVACRPRQN